MKEKVTSNSGTTVVSVFRILRELWIQNENIAGWVVSARYENYRAYHDTVFRKRNIAVFIGLLLRYLTTLFQI
jgi:hypothetical protein